MSVRSLSTSTSVRRAPLALLLVLSAGVLNACNVNLSNRAEARDQWQRHYTVTPGATLDIRNTNGLIHIDATSGNTIDVTADRIVRAPDDDAAKSALAKFESVRHRRRLPSRSTARCPTRC